MKRLSIDEAIAQEKEAAKEKYIEAMLCHSNPNDEKLDGCIECAKEHEQIAEWLEELKDLREMRYRVKNMSKAVEEIIKRMKQELSKAEDRKEQYEYANNLSAMYNMVDMEEQRVSTIQEMLDIVQVVSSEKHEQYAKWLEELKEIKSDGFTDDLLNIGFTKGYRKALDDFVNACKETILCKTFGLRECDIEKIAEQLKAGGLNE